MKRLVIGDIHGCFHTLQNLIAEHKPDVLFCCGDYCDRGKYTKETIQFLIDNQDWIHCVKGNHDDMMVRKSMNWLHPQNGGEKTLQSYRVDGKLVEPFDEHREWLRKLPLFIQVGRHIISHASYPKYEQSGNGDDIIWRRSMEQPSGDYISIQGHTPMNQAFRQEGLIFVDTGCVFGYALSGYDLDTEEFIRVECDPRDVDVIRELE